MADHHYPSLEDIHYRAFVLIQKYLKRRKRERLVAEDVSFSKKEDAITVRPQSPLSESIKKELEKKHPGDDGPTLRDGKSYCSSCTNHCNSKTICYYNTADIDV